VNLTVDTGAGNDRLDASGLALTGPISGPAGGNGNLMLGSGNDTVNISSSNVGGLTIDLGAGDDKLTVDHLNVFLSSTQPGTLNVTGGTGNDSVTLNNMYVDTAMSIDLGSGNDSLTINTSDVGSAAINLGTNNDKLTANGLEARVHRSHGA